MTKLIDKFGKDVRWTNWRYEMVKGKRTKVPYFSKTRKASSTDKSTWKTYEEVSESLDNGSNKFSGIGIFFSDNIIGVDMDHCVENGIIINEHKNKIESFIKESNTYCELSPSKSGLHFFFLLSNELELTANKHNPFEVYKDRRYFTVTNDTYIDKEVRSITSEDMVLLLSIIGYPWGAQTNVATTINCSEDLSDEKILELMFGSKKIGAKMKALYNGDISQYENDASKADYALCNSLAFWSGKNATQIERIWLSSPLGKREKTKKRKDYQDRTVSTAISKCKNVYESRESKMKKESGEIDFISGFNSKGEIVIVQNTENICRVLREHNNFKGRFRYDSFKNILEIKPTKTDLWRQLEDNDAVNIQTGISMLFPSFSKVGKDMVYDAIIKVAKENIFDSAIQYITSLTWDKHYRLDKWLTNVYGSPDDSPHRAIGSNWIKGMIKRLIEPGCKFDFVLVLEGPQGSKKSTSLYTLGGAWHSETTMSTDTKDFFMQFQGKSIIEFSEGETLSRTEVKRMKAIITMQTDRFRAPYERSPMDFPRRCVFAMTTNQDEYLKDETGNRRWLPVKVLLPQANIEWLKENREQLFAEAYHRLTVHKETVYEFPEEIFAMQQARRIGDPNSELITDWYYNKLDKKKREEGIIIFQVYRDALCGGYPSKIMSKYDEMSIADTLKSYMKLIKRQTMTNGIRSMRWFNPNEEVEMTPEQMAEEVLVKGNF